MLGRLAILVSIFAVGCAPQAKAPAQPEQHASCIMAGATKVLARDVDPDVPLVGHVENGTLSVVYESTTRGRMRVDVKADDLSIVSASRADIEPIPPSVNGPVRLLHPEYPAIAFIAQHGERGVLDIAPLACGNEVNVNETPERTSEVRVSFDGTASQRSCSRR